MNNILCVCILVVCFVSILVCQIKSTPHESGIYAEYIVIARAIGIVNNYERQKDNSRYLECNRHTFC